LLCCFFCLFLCLASFLRSGRICCTLRMGSCSFLLRLLLSIKLERAAAFPLMLFFYSIRRMMIRCSIVFFVPLYPVGESFLFLKRKTAGIFGIKADASKRCFFSYCIF